VWNDDYNGSMSCISLSVGYFDLHGVPAVSFVACSFRDNANAVLVK
jgi:hypothetical protein